MNKDNLNKIIDTHAHLDFPDLYPRIQNVIADANLNDVCKIVTISTNLSKIDKIIQISQDNSEVFFTVGVHPNEVDKDKDYLNYDLIKKISEHPKCVGIGEGGLDYHYSPMSKSNQMASFITQINVARDTNLPLVIHSRDADEDMIKILKDEFRKGSFNAILHCFSSGENLAKCGIDLGFFVSFSGIITFKSAKSIQEIAKKIPIDRILVETDSPYLAPTPYRGSINEPKNCLYVAKFLSELRLMSFEQLSKSLYNNSMKVFYKIPIWEQL